MGDIVRIQVCGFDIDDSNYNILVALMVERQAILKALMRLSVVDRNMVGSRFSR